MSALTLQDLERDFLHAANILVAIQQLLLDRVEAVLGMSAYDFWIRRVGEAEIRKRLDDDISDVEWRYRFHGLELDAEHLHDNRFARLELGPHGMTNVFSGWSIGVFVVSTKPPWPTFTRLQNHLNAKPRYPCFQRVCELSDALIRQGQFVYSDPKLVNLRNKYTTQNEKGQSVIDIPRELWPDVPEDVLICDRYVLANSAFIEANAT